MKQIDQIKAEIERRKNELKKDKYITIDAEVCRTSELTYLERFINFLPEEKPSEDLEREIFRYLREDMDRDTTVRDVARHFAQWQKEQMMAMAVTAVVNEGNKDFLTITLPAESYAKLGRRFKGGDSLELIIKED